MEWWQRIALELKKRDWSVSEFVTRMGYPPEDERHDPLVESVYKYIAGDVENPRGKRMTDMAHALGMTVGELRNETSSSALPLPPVNAQIGGPVLIEGRIPVRGQGMGGKDGALVFADQNMGDVLAPPMLVNVPGAYAVYVIGESMEDRFKAGEVVYVHPFLPVRKDDDCVIQIANGDGDILGYIKRFVSRDESTLRVRQFKPAKVLKFPVDKVVACHRIVFSGVG